MRWAGAITEVVQRHDTDVLLGLTALVLLLFISLIRLQIKVGRLSRRKPVVQPIPDEGLIESFDKAVSEIRKQSEQLTDLCERHDTLASKSNLCIQRVGIIRFNAFDDIGGEQSFALALLDAENNGVLISSLLSRTESRTYAKVISAGRSEQVLSQEEQQALSRAIKV